MNAQNSNKRTGQVDGPYVAVAEALSAVSETEWRQLAKLAEYLLNDLKADRRLATYLAGERGEEIVHNAVLAVQLGANTPGKGRAVNREHLETRENFLAHLRQIIRSLSNNYRRHIRGKMCHQTIGDKTVDGSLCEPADAADIEKNIALNDLLAVVIPRVFKDLERKPKQLAVLKKWVESNGHDTMLPPVQSKFVRYCVRQAVMKQLRELAASDLKIANPSGKELLS